VTIDVFCSNEGGVAGGIVGCLAVRPLAGGIVSCSLVVCGKAA
jgi:hypothetical protein